ncbi:Utrophin, partial [Fragariocoptes setiger]
PNNHQDNYQTYENNHENHHHNHHQTFFDHHTHHHHQTHISSHPSPSNASESDEYSCDQTQPSKGRRREHNDSERKRRDQLRSAFNCLRDQVPRLKASSKKPPRIQILREAAKEVEQVTRQSYDLQKALEEERARHEIFQERLRQIQSEFSKISKLHEYASHCSTLLNQQSLKRSQFPQAASRANKLQIRRVQFNPYNYRNQPTTQPGVSIDPVSQVICNLLRSFQMMEAVYSRPFGLSSGVIQLCVGKIFKAVLVLRGIVIDAVIVKAYHESFALGGSNINSSNNHVAVNSNITTNNMANSNNCATGSNFVNENNEVDIWSDSKYLVFRKVTQQANAAMLHFQYPAYPEIALKSFVAWLNAYADLYNVVCTKCHSRLRNFLPPTCRDTRLGFDPYHDNYINISEIKLQLWIQLTSLLLKYILRVKCPRTMDSKMSRDSPEESQVGYSEDIMKYQRRVKCVKDWINEKESNLPLTSASSSIDDLPLNEIVELYRKQEKNMLELIRYNKIINDFKAEAQRIMANTKKYSQEERDEVGIQTDALMVAYERLKFLSIDKCHTLQKTIEERQQAQLDAFEQWLSWVESEIKASDEPIGTDYETVSDQFEHVLGLERELVHQNECLEDLSSIILVFDEVDPDTMKKHSKSCEDLDLQLTDINERWTAVCNYADQRHLDLQKAATIISEITEGDNSKQEEWLNRIERRLGDMEEAVSELQEDLEIGFVIQLAERYRKIDLEIRNRFSQFSEVTRKFKKETEELGKPFELLITEFKSKLESWQSRWDTILDRQRMLKYALDALMKSCTKSENHDDKDYINIPLPEPITSSDQDLRRSPLAERSDGENYRDQNSSPANDEPPRAIAYQSKKSPISNGSPSTTQRFEETRLNLHKSTSKSKLKRNVTKTSASGVDKVDHHDKVITDSSQTHETRTTSPPRLESCRVDEWKHALESFSLWLKQVETSLGVEPDMVEDRVVPTWARLSLQDRLSLLDEIEQQVITTCRDEFDRLIAQGEQIIEGLSPDIYDNDVLNLKNILNDIDERWTSVRECLTKRRKEITRTDRWFQLLCVLRELSEWILQKDSELMPKSEIGGDLISVAQQKDYLLHLKKEILAKDSIESSRNEARLFFEIFHCMEKQANRLKNDSSGDHDQDLIGLKAEIEREDYQLSKHLDALMQHIDDRIKRIDEVHRQMHTLQHYMQQFANGLQESELFKSEWPPVVTLDLRALSEQLDQLKSFRERISELETVHKQLNDVFNEMLDVDVPLSEANIRRLDELNTIWHQLVSDVDERQKSIEAAFESLDATEQEFLQTTVDQPWERRVAASKVPYFIDHLNGSISWDHPRFTELMVCLNNYNDVIFSAYRTAIKLRVIQSRLGLSCIMLETLQDTFKQCHLNGKDDSLIGVTEILECLKMIFAYAQRGNPNLDIALCIDLCLSWILSLFDTTRVGSIRTQAFKIGLVILCCATREEKYTYMFHMVADESDHTNDKKLCSLFSDCLQIPRLLAETDAFTGSDSLENNVLLCLQEAKLSECRINLREFLNWLSTEPQFIIWLPVFHRILVAQTVKHKLRCKICRTHPMVGLRYKCLMCFNYNICQNCFLYGRHLVHHKKCNHSMQEYCSTSTSGENVRDITKILRNKFKTRNDKGRTSAEFVIDDEISDTNSPS